MTKVAPSRSWARRSFAAAGLCLTLLAASPARADGPGPPPTTNSKLLPLPAPGTHRLIRIGPQALVMEDDHGQVTMVDETTPSDQPTFKENVAGAATMMAIVTGGLFLFFRRQSTLYEDAVIVPR
jgi:hypothetical protein